MIALNSGHDATAQCQSLGSYCQESVNSQVGAKVGHVLKIGFLGFVVLSIVWFMTRPRGLMDAEMVVRRRDGLLARRRAASGWYA